MIPSWYPTAQAPLLGTFYQEQAEALAARGVDVAVAYINVTGDLRPDVHGIRAEKVNGVATYRYTHPNWTPRLESGRCWQRTRMLQRVYKRIEAEWGRPDVVNLRSSLQGYEAMALCRKEGLPLFFMEHSSYVITEPEDGLIRRRLRQVMAAARVNACVSSAVRRVMEPYGETRIIPDMVDGERFRPLDIPREGEAFLFRAMGQLRPIKGYDGLIDAFIRLKGMTERPVRLEIAGTGGLREELQRRIDQGGVGDCCRLVGAVPREEAVAYMNGCDCFICSSRTETLSCVLNESAACGKPVISTRCGGPEDIVTPDSGLLVPPEDSAALAEAMRTMLERASLYDGEKIREQTLRKFGVDAVCDQLIRACEDTMKAEKGEGGKG